MHRARRMLWTAAPWAVIAALVLVMLLKLSHRSTAESVLITGIAVSVGLLLDNLATQFRTHVLGFWDRGL